MYNLRTQFEQGGAVKQAQGLAALGRGEDTQLIHMTPSEIQNLQTLAQKYGGGLTVNPNTGLPEAGFLKNILPMLVGGALAIGTGGLGLTLAPWMVGGAMGLGGLAASGGDLGQAAKWGLGGLGGASIATSLGAAGGETARQQATNMAIAKSPTLTGQALTPAVTSTGTTLANVGRGLTSPDVLSTLGSNKLGLAASAAGMAAGYKPPTPEDPPEIKKEKNFFPEGGYQTSRTAQNVAPMERDSFGNFIPRTFEASYFNPNDGGITQVNPNARNYYGPEGTEPNFYGGGPYGTDSSAAYTPPSSVKGPFGIMMNPSKNPNAEKYNYPVGGYQYAAQGGLMGFADGGLTKGPGDGMSDDIMTSISGQQPAALSPGEFVVPADVVSDMGNGDTGAGAKQLYAMMDRVRKARGGSIEQPDAINPNEYMPA
tara:strand:- start:5444 stop:6724 length:1281 start_codon:yes stop_codon:yes gene_type:complete